MRVIAGTTAEIPVGGRKIVDVARRSIGVFNVGGRYYALRNRCPHKGGPLCTGVLLGELTASRPGQVSYRSDRTMLICPWHGWEFDVRTGQSWIDPVRTRVRNYEVDVISGAALASADAGTRIPGPYVAETHPVRVEDDYVIVDVAR